MAESNSGRTVIVKRREFSHFNRSYSNIEVRYEFPNSYYHVLFVKGVSTLEWFVGHTTLNKIAILSQNDDRFFLTNNPQSCTTQLLPDLPIFQFKR